MSRCSCSECGSNVPVVDEVRIPIVARSVLFPFILLTTLFAWWGLANNMTDTLLPAFKKIMSFDDGKTAWIQVVCYALGYGCFAIPGAIFMKRFSYKSGVLLGLGMFVLGTLLFFPSKFFFQNPSLCYFIYLGSIMITFGGLSVLETACNPYICAMGDPATATQRLNLAQSFNPLGSIAGVVLSQIFILSQLNPLTAEERAELSVEKLAGIQYGELSAISLTYVSIGLILLFTWFMIFLTRMPNLREEDKSVDFWGTWRRLFRNGQYVWGVIAQFFYVGAQIACWSFTVRYCMVSFNLEELAGNTPHLLRSVEPIGAFFYDCCEKIGFTVFIPRTAEQAGATYYIFSLIFFVVCRFVCTGLMRFIRPSSLLAILSGLAVFLCILVSQFPGIIGVYSLIGVSGCMSLMFPTIFSMGTSGLGEDTKMGGAGMVMAICGAALLTQLQGSLSDHLGAIEIAYFVPAAAFSVITFYSMVICRKRAEISSGSK